MTTANIDETEQIIKSWGKHVETSLAYFGVLSLADLVTFQMQPEIIRVLEQHFKLVVTGNVHTFLQHYRVKYYTKHCLVYLNSNTCLKGAARFDDREVIDLVIVKGVTTDFNGALVSAAQEGHTDLVKMFLQPTYNVNDIDEPIIQAAAGGYQDIVEMLVQSDIIRSPRTFDYALSCAAKNGHRDLVKMLLQPVYDVFYVDTAIINAATQGHHDIIELIIQSTSRSISVGTLNIAMCRAAEHGYRDIVTLMITRGACNFNNAMIEAARHGHRDIVQLMLAHGARTFGAALTGAARRGYYDIVELMITRMIDHDVDLNSSNSTIVFNDAMRSAIQKGYLDIAKLLLIHACDNFNLSEIRASANYFEHHTMVAIIDTYISKSSRKRSDTSHRKSAPRSCKQKTSS